MNTPRMLAPVQGPLQRVHCNRNGKGECRLYTVDDFVVWKAQP